MGGSAPQNYAKRPGSRFPRTRVARSGAADRYWSGEGSATAPARGVFGCRYSVVHLVAAGDPVRLARGYGRTGPPALVTTSRPRTVRGNGGRGRRFHLAPA